MSDLPPLANLANLVMRGIYDHPDVNWRDALGRGQLASKLWLIDALSQHRTDLGNVLVVAGWLGVLPMLLLADERMRTRAIRSIDKDPTCALPADRLNRFHVRNDWMFKAFTADAHAITYRPVRFTKTRKDGSEKIVDFTPDTVINTSMEHFADAGGWFRKLPKGMLAALQVSADPNYDDHVSPIESLEVFRAVAPFSQELAATTREFGGHIRHMRIGIV